jgi:L-lysine 6-transaminase
LERLTAKFPKILSNPRGIGLYQGFSLVQPVAKSAFLDAALQEEDLLMLGAGTNSVRLRPTLSVTNEEIDLLLEKLERCCVRLKV